MQIETKFQMNIIKYHYYWKTILNKIIVSYKIIVVVRLYNISYLH